MTSFLGCSGATTQVYLYIKISLSFFWLIGRLVCWFAIFHCDCFIQFDVLLLLQSPNHLITQSLNHSITDSLHRDSLSPIPRTHAVFGGDRCFVYLHIIRWIKFLCRCCMGSHVEWWTNWIWRFQWLPRIWWMSYSHSRGFTDECCYYMLGLLCSGAVSNGDALRGMYLM